MAVLEREECTECTKAMARAGTGSPRADANWMRLLQETTGQKAIQWRLAKRAGHRRALQSSRIPAPAAMASPPQAVEQAWAVCRTEPAMEQAEPEMASVQRPQE